MTATLNKQTKRVHTSMISLQWATLELTGRESWHHTGSAAADRGLFEPSYFSNHSQLVRYTRVASGNSGVDCILHNDPVLLS